MPTEPNFFDRKLIALIILLLGSLVAHPADFRPNDTATPSWIAFELDGYEISEDATNLVVTVYRMGDFRTQAAVDFTLEEGTATPGKDFKGMGGTITFPGGQSYKTITIPIIADDELEENETFTVVLSNPTPNAEIVQSEAAVVIKNSVPLPRLAITAGHGTIVLTWQPNGKDLVLQRSEQSAGAAWSDVETEPAQIEGRMIVEEEISNTLYFYRLRTK